MSEGLVELLIMSSTCSDSPLLAFFNLTGNAIKALNEIENPVITWKAWQEKNVSYLSITDNGKGATDQQFKALYDDKEIVGIKTGLGLHLIRDLAKSINCEIKVTSKIDEGSTFILKL